MTGLEVETIQSSCAALIVADGTSCRYQIADGTGRQARHVAAVLAEALPSRTGDRPAIPD